jgi:hypothetical protein
MECDSGKIAGYFEDQLDFEAYQRLQGHLRSCIICSHVVEILRELHQLYGEEGLDLRIFPS